MSKGVTSDRQVWIAVVQLALVFVRPVASGLDVGGGPAGAAGRNLRQLPAWMLTLCTSRRYGSVSAKNSGHLRRLLFHKHFSGQYFKNKIDEVD
jgi:hypothetical protein